MFFPCSVKWLFLSSIYELKLKKNLFFIPFSSLVNLILSYVKCVKIFMLCYFV